MGIVRKIKREPKSKGKTRCCGEQMTYKDGYNYVCERCGKVKKGGKNEMREMLRMA
jgi:hypothetical protein